MFCFYTAFAYEITDFETRQKILQDIKKVVQNEESIARAYEQYILTNYNIPSSITDLYTSDYLGTKTQFLSSISGFATYFVEPTFVDTKISYELSNTLKADLGIKTLYESDTFRKKTYYRADKINFILENPFAKHLYDLIKQNGSGLITCSSSFSGKNCVLNNHIYIKPTYTGTVITGYLMSYHKDKFKTGPILITDNTALHVTSSEFNSIPKGALLYDIKGVKYVKTTAGIEVLK